MRLKEIYPLYWIPTNNDSVHAAAKFSILTMYEDNTQAKVNPHPGIDRTHE